MSTSSFLSCSKFAVVGASTNRNKFGNKLVRHYKAFSKEVIPVHPKEQEIEGLSVKQLSEIKAEVNNLESIGISIVT